MVDIHTDAHNPVFGIETRGIDFIPERERTLSVNQLMRAWLGTSMAPYILILGIIGFTFGLPVGLLIALLAIAVVLSYLAVGLGGVPGARSGIATMQVSIPAVGVELGRVNAGLSWLVAISYEVINAVTGVFAALALFDLVGWDGGGNGPKLVAMIVVFAFSVLAAFLGHATIVRLQGLAGVALAAATVALLISTLDDFDIGARIGEPLDTTTTITLSVVFLGLAVATHSSYLGLASDVPRYLPTATPIRSIVRATLVGAAIPALILGTAGVLLASQTDRDLAANPFDLRGFLPDWLFGLFLVSAVVGTVMNNAVTVYSGGLCAQTTGLPLSRAKAVLVDAVIATAGIVWVLFISDNVLDAINDAIVFAVVWNAPWATVWLLDSYSRRWTVTTEQIVTSHASTRWRGIVAQVAGTIVAALSISVPSYVGPIADVFNGADLAWAFGPLVAAGVYLSLRPHRVAVAI